MSNTTSVKSSIDAAISKVLQNNFDSDSKVCLLTLLKIIDSVLQKPGNPKVRKIRKTNAAIQTKIVERGGVDLLQSVGFVDQQEDPKLLQTNDSTEIFLVLPEHQENTETLVTARHMLSRVLTLQLHCKAEELPKYQPPPPKATIATTQNNSGSASFNVYQGQRYDGQSAAVGTHLGPPKDWKSATDSKLEKLQQQQQKLQTKLQKKNALTRNWFAILPGQSNTTSAISSISTTNTPASSSPLACRAVD